MKRHLIHTILLLLIGTILLSCSQDMDKEPDSSNKGKVEVSFLLNLSQRVQQKSRSTGDDYIDPNNIYLLVFDVDDTDTPTTLREFTKALPGVSTNNFTAVLTPSPNKSAIYIVANFTIDENLVNSSFDNIQKTLKTTDLQNADNKITIMPSSHPMISDPQLFKSITDMFTMGTTANPIKLYRNTVKINASTVELATTSPFELESISLYNAPVAGYVFPGVEAAKTLARYNYAENLKQTWNHTTKQTGDILCYEAPLQTNAGIKKSPFVIIKGKYNDYDGYYRVEFIQKNASGASVEIPLLRNCIFTFNIKHIQRAGYATIEEAILNTASNAIIYDVFVEDMFSTDIVSNGEQYLGVSNSELVVHTDQNVKAENVLAVTVSYTTKSTWTAPGKITCSTGIIPISGAEIPLSKNGIGTHEDMDIYISLEDGFTTGEIMLSIGDLRKKITVRRSILPGNTPMTYDGGYMEVTHQQATNYKPILLAEVLDPHVTTWIRLATSRSRGDTRAKIVLKHDLTGQPSENLYVHVWGNEEAINTSNTIPKGYFYISYANDYGRTRYCVIKEVTELNFNANGGHGQPNNIYEWIKQRIDNNKAYVLLPQVEPRYDGYIFKGWTKNNDGTGLIFQPNTLYTTTFGAKDELYAKWELKPVLMPYIFVGGLYWSVGNLVANGENAAKVGTSAEHGLMFKFGSLIGFDRGTRTATLKPEKCTISAPNVMNSSGVGYTLSGNIPATDAPITGIGDPCRYYLGNSWRLPTKADYNALNLSRTNFTGTFMKIEGENEEGNRSSLTLSDAKMYRKLAPTNWTFSTENTMYQTTAITAPFGFTSSGGLSPGGDGWQESESLGAVRCVRDRNPNTN